ncbi:MAG: cobalt ECF transporter T component CbiQ [Spirochaetes bacterium]|nr:cobalt ECF transporter T component CbiQ [Spirochaetota bacterium]
MRHDFIDKYSGLDTGIHHLDSRTKFLGSLFFIIVIVLTPPDKFLQFVLFFLVLVSLMLMSRVPLLYVFKRSLVIIPFVGLFIFFIPFIKRSPSAVWSKGLLIWNVFIKSYLAVLSLIVLTSTTSFHRLLAGLEKMKVSKIFILILSFMYRYLFVLIEEVEQMERAWRSKGYSGTLGFKIRTFSQIIGVLFIRTYEKAERVYQSMLSRGFSGDIRILTPDGIKSKDIILISIFSIMIIIIRRIF